MLHTIFIGLGVAAGCTGRRSRLAFSRHFTASRAWVASVRSARVGNRPSLVKFYDHIRGRCYAQGQGFGACQTVTVGGEYKCGAE